MPKLVMRKLKEPTTKTESNTDVVHHHEPDSGDGTGGSGVATNNNNEVPTYEMMNPRYATDASIMKEERKREEYKAQNDKINKKIKF